MTATLSHPSSAATTITVSAAAGEHTVSADFKQTGTTLSIAAGDTTSTGTVTIAAVDDTTDAAHDKTVTVNGTAQNSQGVGTVTGASVTLTDDDVNKLPSFGTVIENQEWPVETEIARLDLPEATGGDGALTYTMTPALPSWLTRNGFAVTGTTPATSAPAADYTWTVRDSDGDEASLTFAIAVTESTVLSEGGMLSLAISSPRVTEGAAGATAALSYAVTLSAASTEQVTVKYADAGTGTAASGTDYAALGSGTLTFAPGDTSKTVTVTVTGDGVDEPNETVKVSLSLPVNANVPVSGGTGTGTIEDDDAAPTVALAVADSAIAEDGGTTAVTATLSHASSAATTVTVQPVSGAYTVGPDATITIAAGETTNATDSVTVTAVDDAVDNVGDRAVTVTGMAANAQAAAESQTVAVTGASLTLTDDEATPAVTLALSEPDALKPDTIDEHDGTNPGSSTVTATLDRASSEAVTLTIAATAGTNAAATDFNLSSAKTLTIAGGGDEQHRHGDGERGGQHGGRAGQGSDGLGGGEREQRRGRPGERDLDDRRRRSRADGRVGGSERLDLRERRHDGGECDALAPVERGDDGDGDGGDGLLHGGLGRDDRDSGGQYGECCGTGDGGGGGRRHRQRGQPHDDGDGNGGQRPGCRGVADGGGDGGVADLDDDEATPAVTLALSEPDALKPDTIDEHDGTNPGSSTVTATLDRASSEAVTLTIAAAAGTNAAATDFNLSSAKTLDHRGGETSSTGTVTVSAVDNTVDAPDKEVTVSAVVSGNSGVAAPANVT